MLTNTELIRVEPRAFVRRMLRDFDRCLEEGWAPLAAQGHVCEEFEWTPTLEVVEKEGRLIARFELPGLTKEEITATVNEEGLTVTGERKREEEKKHHNWYRTERTYGKFVRTVPLPVGVNTADVKATFDNGVLELVVPLPPAAVAAAPRRVEIAAGEPHKAKTAA
jgi:HSP20 family protein